MRPEAVLRPFDTARHVEDHGNALVPGIELVAERIVVENVSRQSRLSGASASPTLGCPPHSCSAVWHKKSMLCRKRGH